MSEKGWTPYNGKSTTISRIIEALIVAAVVGGITLFGNYQVVSSKLESIGCSITEMKVDIKEFKLFATDSKIDRALLRQDIKTMDERLEKHMQRDKR